MIQSSPIAQKRNDGQLEGRHLKVLNRWERNNICSYVYSIPTAKKGNDDQLIIQSSSIAQTRDDGQLEGKTFEGNNFGTKKLPSDKLKPIMLVKICFKLLYVI